MTETPKRSTRETISQLLVIAILIAILIGAVVLLRQFIDSHNSSAEPSTTASFSYSCCTGFNPNAVYHPGEVVHVTWVPVENPPSPNRAQTITLRAFLSDTFPTPRALKSSVAARHFPTSGGSFSARSNRMHVSNRSDAARHMSIRIPVNAKSGYYNLATRTSQKDLSTFGGSIVHVRR